MIESSAQMRLTIPGEAQLPPVSETVAWIARAADNPAARQRDRLPDVLDFRRYAGIFRATYNSAPAGVELGFPIVLRDGELYFPESMAYHNRYSPFIEGGRFVGGFHVHPPAGASPPFFDPQDLSSTLRSDNPGFIDLLLTRDRLFVLVRSSPFLYISAHHVNRNPHLLMEQHQEFLNAHGSISQSDPPYEERYRKAGLYFFDRYGLALYEGSPKGNLKRTVEPSRYR